MGINVLAGEGINILATGTRTVSSEDSDFGDENLVDGRADQLFKFSAPGTSDTITVDGSFLVNGTLDTWSSGIPTGWDTEGTITQSTDARSGSAAQLMATISSGTSDRSLLTQDCETPAGKRVNFEFYTKVSSTGLLPCYALQDLETGDYWSVSASAWSTSPVTNTATPTTTYALTGPNSLTLQTFREVGKDQTTLRLTLLGLSILGSAATSDYMLVDDAGFWPSVNHGSIHGHNIRADVSVLFESSPDNFSTSSSGSTFTQATMTKTQPAFYSALSSAIDHRYWRYQFKYTSQSSILGAAPTDAIAIGEAVIGQTVELERGFNYGSRVTLLQDTVVGRNMFGSQVQAFKFSQQPRRVLDLEFDYFTESEYLDGLEVWERAAGNSSPVVVVPDTCSDVVLLGHLEPVFSVSRTLTEHYTGSQVRITESPFAVVTS